MKYFREGRTKEYGPVGIILEDSIFSLQKDGENIIFAVECDCYFTKTFSKSESIELLKEAIDWIESDLNENPT